MFDNSIDIDWISVSTFFKEFFLPIISLVFSTFAFYISFRDRQSKKRNLSILPITDIEEWIVDRESSKIPDIYHQLPLRCMFEVLLTNNSSLPITIIEFHLSDDPSIVFNRYVEPGITYNVQIVENELIKLGEYASKAKTFAEGDILKMPFTIKPYEAAITGIIFGYTDTIVGSQTLLVRTSRGDLEQKIQVSKQVGPKSRL
ncbi:hypothetical protein IGI37_001987 [Enterococcus sp. AZ194]|uniref:hypothetical protein n=1 Tax=Enterococcus sp. AZ194 TaxID=2774629 RepID=UPI003F25DCE7